MKLKRMFLLLILGISSSANADCMLGELMTFAGNFVPRGYAAAEGQLLPISQNAALFSILGTTYGGDGRTTFALPNVQNGLAHRPAANSSSSDRIELKTLICVSGSYPSRS